MYGQTVAKQFDEMLVMYTERIRSGIGVDIPLFFFNNPERIFLIFLKPDAVGARFEYFLKKVLGNKFLLFSTLVKFL